MCARAQGLRVVRRRQAIQDILASEDTELDGLGAASGATVLRAAAAGAHACCLMSGCRLQLMALEEGEEDEADLLPAVAEEDPEGDEAPGTNGGDGDRAVSASTSSLAPARTGGVTIWDDVEATCMFGIRVRRTAECS